MCIRPTFDNNSHRSNRYCCSSLFHDFSSSPSTYTQPSPLYRESVNAKIIKHWTIEREKKRKKRQRWMSITHNNHENRHGEKALVHVNQIAAFTSKRARKLKHQWKNENIFKKQQQQQHFFTIHNDIHTFISKCEYRTNESEKSQQNLNLFDKRFSFFRFYSHSIAAKR